MKPFLFLTGALALAALLRPADAQTTSPAPAPTPRAGQAPTGHAKPADRRAAAYTGPKVVGTSEELGQRMLQKSKPAERFI